MNSTISRWMGELHLLEDGWDSYVAAPPNEDAMQIAADVIDEICTLIPPKELKSHNSLVHSEYVGDKGYVRVSPTAVGGVLITLRNSDRKVCVECYNTGNTQVMFVDGEEIWVDFYRQRSIFEIKNFLGL